MSRSSLMIGVLMWAMIPADIAAQSASRQSLTVLQDGEWNVLYGTVHEIRGPHVAFESDRGVQVRTFSFDQIRSFNFSSSSEVASGFARLKSGHSDDAETLFRSALKNETRDWAKVELLAAIARSVVASGRREEAIPLFQQIFRIAPDSRLFGQMPLVWNSDLPKSERLNLPIGQLTSGDEVTQLAVASCVLHEAKEQIRASMVLKQLQDRSKSSVLAQLATAQLWRLSILAEGDSVDSAAALDLKRYPMLTDVWRTQWHRMPATSKVGPAHVLGRCLKAQHQYDQASLILLWSPLVRSSDPALAAASLREAILSLEAVNRQQEADTVYRELVRDYRGFSAADFRKTPNK